MGRIAKVSMETWVRGGDGKAKQEGLPKDLLDEPRMEEILAGDILPPPYHGTTVVDLDGFRDFLPVDIPSLARDGCQEVVRLWNKCQGDDAEDEDYEDERNGR